MSADPRPSAESDQRASELIDELARQLAESEVDYGHDPEMWQLTAAKALLSAALQRAGADADDTAPKCTYETGPCAAMQRHATSAHAAKRTGIVALDNRLNMKAPGFRMMHAGFALMGAPGLGRRPLMLNFCPWCGADLMAWHDAYRTAFDAAATSAEAGES